MTACFAGGGFISSLCGIYTFFIKSGVVSICLMATTYNLPVNPSPWKVLGTVFGLGGGLMAPIIGCVLTIVSWVADPSWHGLSLHVAATSLFVLTFPLLLLGAHCLDLLEKEKARID